VGVVDGLDEQTISTLKLRDDGLGKVDKAQVRVLVIDVLCQLGNALRVGLGLELVALGLEESLKLLVVCNDAIVDDGELPGGVRPVQERLRSALLRLQVVRGRLGWNLGVLTCEGGSSGEREAHG
jgi:hypothetical protein